MGKFTGRTLIIGVTVLVCAFYAGSVNAEQFFPTSLPNSAPALSSRASGELDGIPINSGMFRGLLPTIPNLELGFQYFFGDRVRSNQANADYLLPYNLSPNSVIFGEAHGNWWNFTNKPVGGASNRIDLSFGGGYRKILSDQLLVGLNGFYDSSRLFDQWYSSGSVGLELAANIGTSDAVDLNANWYGDIFSSTDILNAFRNKGGSYDIEAGYSHAMFDNSLDLRLKFAGYQFDTGSSVYGYKTGADLTTKEGMFMLRYEYGSDRINGQWNNIGAFVNVGFQMENVIKGESPFTMPEPIFKSPRNLRRMLTQKVKRDWTQQYAPGRAALSASSSSCAHPGYYKLITNEITENTAYYTTPISPVGDQVGKRITIYWCGYKGSLARVNPYVVWGDQGAGGTDQYNVAAFDISGSSGSYTQVMYVGGINTSLGAFPYIYFVVTGVATTLEFDNGGGISFTIN